MCKGGGVGCWQVWTLVQEPVGAGEDWQLHRTSALLPVLGKVGAAAGWEDLAVPWGGTRLPPSAVLHLSLCLHHLGERCGKLMVHSGRRWGLLHCFSCWCPVPARLLSLFLAALGIQGVLMLTLAAPELQSIMAVLAAQDSA